MNALFRLRIGPVMCTKLADFFWPRHVPGAQVTTLCSTKSRYRSGCNRLQCLRLQYLAPRQHALHERTHAQVAGDLQRLVEEGCGLGLVTLGVTFQ